MRHRSRRLLQALPLLAALAPVAAACRATLSPPASPRLQDISLLADDGRHLRTGDFLALADWTVLVFFSRECPCFAAHDSRLRELADTFAPRGVSFVAVDSEVGETPDIARAEATKRQYPFPIVVDPGALLANQLGAEYATYTVILDRAGRVLYQGGIDSDKQRLHADATLYVRDALTDLLAGRAPHLAEGKALGCVLRRW